MQYSKDEHCICNELLGTMSGGIEEPYTIAALAKPLDAEHGRIVGASVHSVAGSRKRKRHEVAIGVDGESVSIYNVWLERCEACP